MNSGRGKGYNRIPIALAQRGWTPNEYLFHSFDHQYPFDGQLATLSVAHRATRTKIRDSRVNAGNFLLNFSPYLDLFGRR